jgi:hypothetical protein
VSQTAGRQQHQQCGNKLAPETYDLAHQSPRDGLSDIGFILFSEDHKIHIGSDVAARDRSTTGRQKFNAASA